MRKRTSPMKPFDLPLLFAMFTYCRPEGTATERAFVERFVLTLPHAIEDSFGNVHVIIGKSPIVWSCHTDTVHRSPGFQTVHYDPNADSLCLSKKSRRTSACLGADDTTGVFLCHEMI